MQRKKCPLYTGKLRLDFFLGGIDDHCRSFPENQLFDLNEAEQVSVSDISGVNLVDLALIMKYDFEKVSGRHLGSMLLRTRSLHITRETVRRQPGLQALNLR